MKQAKPTLLIDGNPLVGNKSGIGHYTYRLIEALAKTNQFNIVVYYFNFLGRKSVSNLPAIDDVTYKTIRFFPTKIINLFHRFGVRLPLELFVSTKGVDYILFPNFVAVPTLRKIPYAVAVHDLCYEDLPKFVIAGNRRYLQHFVGPSVEKSSLIVTISNFTKSRIEHYYGHDAANKTHAFPIPFEAPATKNGMPGVAQIEVKRPYLLYVGTLEPRKNIPALIRGFNLTNTETRSLYSLVLAGAQGWDEGAIQEALAEIAPETKVVITGYVTESDRAYLYKNSDLVCNVSHYEGFGMQLLEASHYHKNMVLSDIPVFHEVAGSGATYCNKDDPKAIARAIESALKHTSYKPLQEKHKSWQSIATEISEAILQSLSNQR